MLCGRLELMCLCCFREIPESTDYLGLSQPISLQGGWKTTHRANARHKSLLFYKKDKND